MAYETILVEKNDAVGVITLNRPDALNALSDMLANELTLALQAFEKVEEVGASGLTGSERAFAAGADIKEFAPKSYMDAYQGELITANWEEATRCRKPIIAAVAGYALGGGCELAMMCDMIICADTAKFEVGRAAGRERGESAGR